MGVDATGKVDAERLQEEKERVEAEKSDASSKVAEAQEKAKAQIERVKEEAKNEVRQADKKAEKETQQAEKKMQEVEAKDATEGQPSGKKDAELKQMLKSLESGGETKKKESLIPANLVKATQGKLGNSVQNLEDKVRNIQDRAAKARAKIQNIRSQSRVSALAASQKVKLLFGKVAAAEATVRKNRAKTDQSKLTLQGKNKAAQKVDREQQNMLTTLAKAETALAQASDVKQAKQAKDFLVTVRKQVLAVQKMKSASDAKVTIAQKGLESTTQAEQDSKAVVVGLKNELSGHASDATRHQMQVAKITASMAAAKLTNAKEAQEATKEALDTASSAGDKTSADRIQAIASTLSKKVVKDEEKKAKADSKEAQAEVAANDDIKEKAKAASNQATFKGQAVALKAKLKKLLDQTKVNPKAVKKAVQNLNGIADETKGAIAGAAKEKRKERKLVKKLEKEADGQIKEKVEVAVLEQPELPKAKIKKALEKKAKEIVEEELARGKKPTSQQVMKKVMGKAKDSESEAKKVAAAAAASASGQKTQAKGQNSQSSSVRQDADNVAAAKKKAADAATKLAEVSTQLAN